MFGNRKYRLFMRHAVGVVAAYALLLHTLLAGLISLPTLAVADTAFGTSFTICSAAPDVNDTLHEDGDKAEHHVGHCMLCRGEHFLAGLDGIAFGTTRIGITVLNPAPSGIFIAPLLIVGNTARAPPRG